MIEIESGSKIGFLKGIGIGLVGSGIGAAVLIGCGEQKLYSDDVVVEGSVPKAECDKVPWLLGEGSYQELKKTKAASREVQREVCKNTFKIARKIVEVYQEGNTESTTVYSESNENSKIIRLHTVTDPDTSSERGGSVAFKMKKDGTANLRKILSVTTHVASIDSSQAVHVTTNDQGNKVEYSVQNWSAAMAVPIPGYCMIPIDVTSNDRLGQRVHPTIPDLEQQKKDVSVVMSSMVDMVTQDPKLQGC